MKTHDTTDGDEREQLIDWIADTQRLLGRVFARDRSLPLLATTLTMQQLKVIVALSFHESASGQELARELGIGLGTLTGIVDRLVAHGLLTRREDPADRRVRRLTLTTEGRTLTDDMLDAGASNWRQLLTRLDTDTLRDMSRVMRRISEVITEELGSSDDSGDRVNPHDTCGRPLPH
ncbi:MarR family winged helix-turn-helix transcriptional regulator [Herbidospora daliensis]|uniref:MarR family winged helix-turn-helix transcriptional regulator n=1 Tax=Herbidospora daliensis TaxID=295585 RepID=UPI0007C75634|nr:MarR family transcriptional regulator [Herbidospora daliensis]